MTSRDLTPTVDAAVDTAAGDVAARVTPLHPAATAPGAAASHAAEATAHKRPFVRATEVWVPTRDRTQLELASSLYGPLTDFEAASTDMRFDYDEGLPGKAWAAGHPIVLKDLTTSYFKRGAAAQGAGLTCGVAIPIFSGRFIMAVLVLFCGDEDDHVGAIEVWNAPPDSPEMGLADGYYGAADVFEWTARRTKFMRDVGLPGQVWASGMPVVMSDLGTGRFLRWESAREVGIARGLGLPVDGTAEGSWVLTLLSALGTPIARRFEVWVPNPTHGGLDLRSGYCEHDGELGSGAEGVTRIAADAGALGGVLRSGVPALCADLSTEPEPIAAAAARAGLESLVAAPVIAGAELQAVVAWYL